MVRRTTHQNRALWLFFEKLAEELNDAGLSMQKVLKPGVEIPWNKDMVHDFLWCPIQKAMTGEESTTQLEKIDVNAVYEVLARHLAEKLEIVVPDFPSEANDH